MLKLVSPILVLVFTGPQDEPREPGNSALRHSFEEELSSLCDAHLQLLLSEMKDVLSLPAATVDQLKLAAKGTADKHAKNIVSVSLDELLKNLAIYGPEFELHGKRLSLEGSVDQNTQEQKTTLPKVAISLLRTRANFSILTSDGHLRYSKLGGIQDLLQETPWRKTVEKLIDEEGRLKFTDFERSRAHRSAAEVLLSVLRYELRLRDDQVPPIREWVLSHERLHDVFERKLNPNPIASVLTQVDHATMPQVLTTHQERLFRSLYENFQR